MEMTDRGSLFRLDPATVACPHSVMSGMREEGPAVWVEDIEAFAITRYADVVEVARRPDLFSSNQATGPILARQMMQAIFAAAEEDASVRAVLAESASRGNVAVLLSADPPLHTRQRGLVNRAFTLRKVREREDAMRAITEELVDRFAARGRVELVAEFAVPLPLTVIAQALGVPVARMADFKRWSDDFVVAIGNHNLTKEDMGRMVRSQAEFFEYFTEQIADRRAHPANDVVTDVVTARVDGEELSEPEMLSMFSQFLVAGNETTTKLITSAVLHLTRDPGLADRLRGDRAAIASFVEEVLRLDAPVQGLFRTATQDSEIGGVPIPAGAAVWLVYAAANRDPDAFADADACVLDRPHGTSHLAFGFGEHFCLGASLARAEARIAVEVLLARLDDISLACDEDELAYEPSYVLHGLHTLPLAFSVRAPAA